MTAKPKPMLQLQHRIAALAASVCLGLFAGPSTTYAAAPNTDTEDTSQRAAETAGENPSQNSNDTQAKTNKDDSAKDKNREIFRPSEEISEDFAVSFPVDI